MGRLSSAYKKIDNQTLRLYPLPSFPASKQKPILVLHTGGTIGCWPNGPLEERDGPLKPGPRGAFTDLLRDIWPTDVYNEDMQDIPDSNALVVLELSTLIDSTEATFDDWNRVASLIWLRRDLYSGVVVTSY
jgi:L-asparaginase/Glu-tRNA(Gln) amidotransferase subunit D